MTALSCSGKTEGRIAVLALGSKERKANFLMNASSIVIAAMVDEQNPMERAWLDQLGNALSLDAGLCAEIEKQVLAAE